MPTLDFKGKQFVYAHHLGVAYRTLEVDAKKSVLPKRKKGEKGEKGEAEADGNLIIHGDNLEALKALLPRYGGRVNCIYIDPPYNTGNEGWCYNDNVNAPLMKRWLKDNGEVDREDMERHDKWLCMMWPRLQLLRDLLAEDGVIFISIDDNEQHRLQMVMDEIFGEDNFVEKITWHRKRGKDNSAKFFSKLHEYLIVYAKSKSNLSISRLEMSETTKLQYRNPDNDSRGSYRLLGLWSRQQGGTEFEYTMKSGKHFTKRLWLIGKARMEEMERNNILVNRKDNLYYKKFLNEHSSSIVETIWLDASNNANAKDEIKEIFNTNAPDFETPKPTPYIKRMLQISLKPDGLILDSFAGSGTTAQAVLELNKEDGGNRKFILVECEKYADKITAERVRRVIKGVPKAKDANLKEGLGGSFAFCKLGEAMDLENLISGKKLPDYDSLARYIAHTAAGVSLPKVTKGKDWLFAETEQFRMHLIYKSDKKFLASAESALSGQLAERINKAAGKGKAAKTILVFAPWKFMSQKELTQQGITFCQLPYAIHRLYGDQMETV